VQSFQIVCQKTSCMFCLTPSGHIITPPVLLCTCTCMQCHRLGDVVGTFAWNTTRHLEAWYGIMGLGAICHTLNPRLSDRDITYIAGVGCEAGRHMLVRQAVGHAVGQA
jgi:hypothetical protein